MDKCRSSQVNPLVNFERLHDSLKVSVILPAKRGHTVPAFGAGAASGRCERHAARGVKNLRWFELVAQAIGRPFVALKRAQGDTSQSNGIQRFENATLHLT